MNRIQIRYTQKASRICRDFLIARRQEFGRGSKSKAGWIVFGRNRNNVRVIQMQLESPVQVYSLIKDLERCGQFIFPYPDSILKVR
jgi:hypothetical protein